MALDSDAVFGAAIASAMGVTDTAAKAALAQFAAAINAQIKKATVSVTPTLMVVPISGPAGSTPVTGTGTGTIS